MKLKEALITSYQLDNSILLKSQYPLQGIIFNPVEEAKTFFHYSYNEKKERVAVSDKAINWYNLSTNHLRIHDTVSCELCASFRHFKQSRFIKD